MADPCLPTLAEPAHETEAAVHRQRVPPSARGPASLSQEQPQQPCRPGLGREAPGKPGPLSVLLPPTALPQPPHEVRNRGRGASGLGRGRSWRGSREGPWVQPELIASAFPQVGQRDGAQGHHAPRGLACQPPPLPAPGQGCALSGQDRQARVQGPGGGARQVAPSSSPPSHTPGNQQPPERCSLQAVPPLGCLPPRVRRPSGPPVCVC